VAAGARSNDAGARQIVVENPYRDKPLEETLKKEGWDTAAIQSAAGERPFGGYAFAALAATALQGAWGGFIYQPSTRTSIRRPTCSFLAS
jgi:hypothetical protein